MDISFNCKKCGQHILVDESAAGVSVNCPNCNTQITVPALSDQRAVTTPTEIKTNVTGSGKKKRKRNRIILATMVAVALLLIFALGRSVTRPDRSPLGKTEQQVDRLYGQPVKVKHIPVDPERPTQDLIDRTYLLGDILVQVSFDPHEKPDGKIETRSNHVMFYRDSPVGLFPNRITMQEAQRLMREISGGGRWTIAQADSKHRKEFETHYVYHEESLRLINRKLRYDTVTVLSATYDDANGFLSVSGDSFGDMFSIRDAPATEPSSWPPSSNELAALEAEIKTVETETAPTEEKPTALDLKGGFREYRLGMKKADVSEELTKDGVLLYEDTEDAETYVVKSFDHTLGDFKIDSIRLEFDRRLGLLKKVRVWIRGKQNVEGVLEAFKVAYGETEYGHWHGTDIELEMSDQGDSASATWTSKKVDKIIENDRTRRAREGAADAAKGL